MAWWHRPADAQGMAGYSPRYYGFDFSALPYLLRLIPGPLSSGRPRLALTVSVEEELQAEVRRIPGRKRRSESDYGPTLARPSGRGPDRSPGLSLCIWAGPGGERCRYAVY